MPGINEGQVMSTALETMQIHNTFSFTFPLNNATTVGQAQAAIQEQAQEFCDLVKKNQKTYDLDGNFVEKELYLGYTQKISDMSDRTLREEHGDNGGMIINKHAVSNLSPEKAFFKF